MTDIRDLVGDDLPEEELSRIERVDALLRRTPAPPPEPPPSLDVSVRSIPGGARPWTRRRVAGALALAAAVAAVFFGVGVWAGGDAGFDPVRTVALAPTAEAAGAAGLIRLAAGDDNGNWAFELDVSGLAKLPHGGYYVLWLSRDGDYAGTCGTFNVAADGTAVVRMSASYRLSQYDEWVVSAWIPGDEELGRPWLLRAPV